MFVKITNERIWWDDTTDNKIDINLFNQFKGRMRDTQDKVNYINSRTIQFISRDKSISFIWVNDDKYDYYYYFNRVLKIVNGLYVLEFKLDVFTTLTLPYFEYLREDQIQLKINRQNIYYYQEAVQWEDEMLNSIPKFVGLRVRRTTRTNQWVEIRDQTIPNSSLGIEYVLNNVWGGWVRTINGHKDYLSNPTIYVVADIDGDIGLIPAIWNSEGIQGKTDFNLGTNGNSWYSEVSSNVIKPSSDYTKWYVRTNNTSVQYIVKTIKDGGELGKIQGVYTGPPFYEFNKDDSFLKDYNGQKLVYFKANPSTGIRTNEIGKYPLGNRLDAFFYDRPNKEYNKRGHLSVYASNYVNFKINGQPYNYTNLFGILGFDEQLELQLGSEAYFNFTTNGFFTVYNYYYGMDGTILNYSQELPILIEKYTKYLQSTANVRDTGLNIAKQNLLLDWGDAGLGYLKNKVNNALGALSGNIGGGISNAIFGNVDAYTSFAKPGIGFIQKKAMLNAELADKKAANRNQIQGGSIQDAALATYIETFKDDAYGRVIRYTGDLLEYDEFTPGTIEAMNNVLYLYGVYYPVIMDINTALSAGEPPPEKFYYLKFDAEYLSNIFATTIRGKNNIPLEREFYDEVFSQMVNGLRFWKVKPQW